MLVLRKEYGEYYEPKKAEELPDNDVPDLFEAAACGSVKELDDKVIFLRKLKRGGSEHSFGIHVAQMAGMPKSVVNRANEILKDLEKSENRESLAKPVGEIADHREGFQTTIFQLDDPVLAQIRDEIKELDINNLTPMEALNKLNEIKKHIGLKD